MRNQKILELTVLCCTFISLVSLLWVPTPAMANANNQTHNNIHFQMPTYICASEKDVLAGVKVCVIFYR